MSKKTPSVIDYFTTDGELVDEASEFSGINLEDYVDKRSRIKPNFNSAVSGVMHFDLHNEAEVSFYRAPSVVYGEVTFPNGCKTVLFKCRQKKNLTWFIRKVLEIGSWPLTRIHNDFRTSF